MTDVELEEFNFARSLSALVHYECKTARVLDAHSPCPGSNVEMLRWNKDNGLPSFQM
jgi:hypothetical protein